VAWGRLASRISRLMWMDGCVYSLRSYRRKYIAKQITGEERWIVNAVEPHRARLLPDVQLHLSDQSQGQQPVTVLFGLTDTHPFRADKRASASRKAEPGDKRSAAATSGMLEGPWLLEVVATQYPPSCHVYLVVSFARRQLRQHVCSSGPAASLAAVRMEAGRPLHSPPAPRNDFSNAVLRQSPVDGSMQAFLPSRFVCGLLPQVPTPCHSPQPCLYPG
jgi:hypothetical protein